MAYISLTELPYVAGCATCGNLVYSVVAQCDLCAETETPRYGVIQYPLTGITKLISLGTPGSSLQIETSGGHTVWAPTLPEALAMLQDYLSGEDM